MAITASTLFTRVRSMLDDDNSARYTDAADLVPAMNSAIGYVTTVFSAAFEQKKLQPFALSELTDIWIFNPEVTGNTARISLNGHDPDIFNDEVWAIIGVDPNPVYTGIPPVEVYSYSTKRFAKRLNIEEWNYSLEDPFTPGYEDVPSDFQRVCYTGPLSYLGSQNYPYLLLRPGTLFDTVASRVAVWMLLKHPVIASSATELLFPVTIHSLIEQKMLQYITYQNDDERLFKITDKEVKELIQLMN